MHAKCRSACRTYVMVHATVKCQSWSDGCNVFKGNKVNGNSAWPLAPVWVGVYAWEFPGVTGNACNGLTPTVALQLATVVYGANLFSEPLEDLNAAWLLECLRTLVEGLALSGGRRWSVGEEGRGEVDPNGYGRCIAYLCVAVFWCIEQPWEAVVMEDRRREETRSI
eukprot:Gb_32490 [translate_table: standard]